MKVKSTKNGNVKIVMSPEQAKDLKTILNCSHKIKYGHEVPTARIERTSWEVFTGLSELDVPTHD